MASSQLSTPFRPGAIVIVSLQNPREKFWGALIDISPTGISLRGADLNSIDEFASLMKTGEARPNVLFFPLLRVERMELDEPEGFLPSVRQRFEQRSGLRAAAVLGEPA